MTTNENSIINKFRKIGIFEKIGYPKNIYRMTQDTENTKMGGLRLSWDQIIDHLIQTSSENKVSSQYVTLEMIYNIDAENGIIKS